MQPAAHKGNKAIWAAADAAKRQEDERTLEDDALSP
jgi:hypothetical protein